MKAPVLVFTYNRPEHTRKLFDSLNRCKGVETHDLYVFSDGAKNAAAESQVNAVREYLRKISKTTVFGSITIFEEEKNKGLANSIIDGVTKIIEKYGSAIVLEDDLCIADNFIEYMQSCLDYYESDDEVGAISGFSYSLKCKKGDEDKVYKSRTGNSWGWATWKNRWTQVDWQVTDYSIFKEDVKSRKRFDFQQEGISNMLDRQMEGKIDSWAVRWDYFFFRKGLWTIYPYFSKVVNNGFDGSGIHCDNSQSTEFRELESKSFALLNLPDCKDLTRQTSGYSIDRRIKDCIKKILRCDGRKRWNSLSV